MRALLILLFISNTLFSQTKEAALKAVKTSLELAEKAGNKDYVIMNKASITEWNK